MGNKHTKRRPAGDELATRFPDRRNEYAPVVPRRVIVEFDRFVEHHRTGDRAKLEISARMLRRAGWEPRISSGVGDMPVYWLRAL